MEDIREIERATKAALDEKRDQVREEWGSGEYWHFDEGDISNIFTFLTFKDVEPEKKK